LPILKDLQHTGQIVTQPSTAHTEFWKDPLGIGVARFVRRIACAGSAGQAKKTASDHAEWPNPNRHHADICCRAQSAANEIVPAFWFQGPM